MWYNLSSIDDKGNDDRHPFDAYKRYLEVKGDACEHIFCDQNHRLVECDWPIMGDCKANTGNDVSFYLC